MGESFDYEGLEVVDLLKRTVPYSILISVLSLLFVYVMGIPIGIYSACTSTAWATTSPRWRASSACRFRTSSWR